MKSDLAKIIALIQSESNVKEEEKSRLITTIFDANKPLDSDRWIYRLVVSFLGVSVVATIAGGIYLTVIGGSSPNFQLPQGIVAIGSAAVGALAGLLAPSPNKEKG